ncbi:hypothetical protein CFP65_0999 [Kitasatospora sp. MMS16-BH015]|uniref:nucleotidyltransferase domain-containing protein n=1 Tax=Kitasatospora sp. MMS16-BH015 TaxID=2018025 RepID=UPI000CA131F2|nr:hypothetical protein [Kitasatospora sp. MMS16-BH015]AUG75917.1 hypothetical protein CFP65_0999 [Kitasatospora sp. MMS16-BH015]
MTESLPPGGIVLSETEIDARWERAWRPEQVAQRLLGLAVPWCVAGGWSLDLFRGEESRPHGDLEIAVPAGSFAAVRERFPELAFDAVGSGRIWPSAGPEAMDAVHQTWVRDPATEDWLFDVFREPHEGARWVCRRDERLKLPYEEVIERTAEGIPYLAPEMALLFKAKAVRPKDQLDFDGALPLLGPERRARLRGWLELVHPGHGWLAALA